MQQVKPDPVTVATLAVLLTAISTSAQTPAELEDSNGAAAACVLASIELGGGATTHLELSTSGNPKALEAKVAPGGEGFLLDLVGCVPGPALAGNSFPGGLVSSLELIERSEDGEPVTGVAAKTRGAFQYAVKSSPNFVLVRLQPMATETAASPASVSAAERPAEPRVRVLEPLPGPAASRSAKPRTPASPAAEAAAGTEPSTDRLLAGARLSVTRAPAYDATYRVIAYPGGDPGWHRGSGTDLVVRAYRHLDVDLQQRLHEDVLEVPAAYGIEEPDLNVDHRRVRNLIVFFGRHGERLALGRDADWRAGDVVFWATEGGRPNHVGIVSERLGASGRPLVVHHAKDRTPAEEDVLFAWPVRGHFRWLPIP